MASIEQALVLFLISVIGTKMWPSGHGAVVLVGESWM